MDLRNGNTAITVALSCATNMLHSNKYLFEYWIILSTIKHDLGNQNDKRFTINLFTSETTAIYIPSCQTKSHPSAWKAKAGFLSLKRHTNIIYLFQFAPKAPCPANDLLLSSLLWRNEHHRNLTAL